MSATPHLPRVTIRVRRDWAGQQEQTPMQACDCHQQEAPAVKPDVSGAKSEVRAGVLGVSPLEARHLGAPPMPGTGSQLSGSLVAISSGAGPRRSSVCLRLYAPHSDVCLLIDQAQLLRRLGDGYGRAAADKTVQEAAIPCPGRGRMGRQPVVSPFMCYCTGSPELNLCHLRQQPLSLRPVLYSCDHRSHR